MGRVGHGNRDHYSGDGAALRRHQRTALQYTENAGAVPVDAGLTVTDANDNVLTGATVMILGYVAGQDVLSFAGGGGITGSWNAASGTLTLSGSATVAAYQAALHQSPIPTPATTPALPVDRSASSLMTAGRIATRLAIAGGNACQRFPHCRPRLIHRRR